MKILVTGASGFLGTHLCHALEKEGHLVTRLSSKNCDLTKADSLDAFNGTQYDQIFHLAAWTQAGDFCLYHPGEQWVINQKMNTHV
ncbi:MAG: GDP-L-fucose synthase, partial [Verrucomicrobiales bacterium]|nr:GDP-L-fucose synthase [Verrucomicrobiales bacterium]